MNIYATKPLYLDIQILLSPVMYHSFVLYRRSKMHNHVLLINEMLGNILCPVLLWMELTCNSHEKSVKSTGSLFQHVAFFNKVLVQRKVAQLKANFSFQRA